MRRHSRAHRVLMYVSRHAGRNAVIYPAHNERCSSPDERRLRSCEPERRDHIGRMIFLARHDHAFA